MTKARPLREIPSVEPDWHAQAANLANELLRTLREYRDEDGLTQNAEVLAARYTNVPEGHMLLLYVRLA